MAAGSRAHLSFVIPPSMASDDVIAAVRAFFADDDERTFEIRVARSYLEVSSALLLGDADAAWGPPSTCARLEVHGGRVLLQSVRGGALRYRSALVCRRGETLELPPKDEEERLVAAWTDRDSTAGYLLPRAFLRKRGAEPRACFRQQLFLGSYLEASRAVASGDADLCAVFATAERAQRPKSALDELEPEVAKALHIFAYTQETPNDGFVVSPRVDDDEAERLTVWLKRRAHAAPELVRRAFGADGFSAVSPGAYRALHDIVLELAR